MSKNVTLSENDFDMMLVSATRYALGRRSYIVGWTNDVIRAHIHMVRGSTLRTILEDIKRADSLGMEQDKENWEKTYSLVYNEIREREKKNDTQSTNITRRKKKAVSVH